MADNYAESIAAYRKRRDMRLMKKRKEMLDSIAAFYIRRDARLAARGLPPSEKKMMPLLEEYGYNLLTTGNMDYIIMSVYGNNDSEEENWIEVNGTPVKIEEGQTKEEAVENFIKEKEAEKSNPSNLDIKPVVEYEPLQKSIDEIYKGQNSNNPVGNGTLMDAVRNEIKTGKSTKGSIHTKKARQMEAEMKKHISSGKLSTKEKQVARMLRDDIRKAINGR